MLLIINLSQAQAVGAVAIGTGLFFIWLVLVYYFLRSIFGLSGHLIWLSVCSPVTRCDNPSNALRTKLNFAH